MKAVLIARVSTAEQKEAGNSLPAQVARLERYCQSRGFSIVKICSFDESAYTDQRDVFDRIIDFILEQKEKIAVCCAMRSFRRRFQLWRDRLPRHPRLYA